MHLENDIGKIRCGMIFIGGYPFGTVTSIRIHSYCKALAARGAYVKVLIIAPTSEAKYNTQKKEIYEGVHYEYMTKITWNNRQSSIIVKLLYYFYGLIKSLFLLRKERFNTLLSYHYNIVGNPVYWMATRLLGISFFLDKTEYPNNFETRLGKRVEKFKLHCFDGIITISKELEMFYQSLGLNVFHLPMTVDIDRFAKVEKEETEYPYIAAVFGRHNRDGLYESIVSYNIYRTITKDPYKLLLIGDIDNLVDRNKIIDFIHQNNLKVFIQFTGLIPIKEVPQYIINANCLLTTPNKFVSGGFPTKLGEYLLSGVPVVATRVGEIGDYLTHGENILLSNPGDFEHIAANLKYVQENSTECNLIAQNGLKIAREVFNADKYVDELLNFIYFKTEKRK